MGAPTGLVVDQVWRYPVKSVGGQRVPSATIGPLGVEGDRRWGVVDRATGRALTGRRQPELLLAHVVDGGGGRPELVAGDGEVLADDEALSRWLGRPVALVAAADARGPVEFEVPDPDEVDWGSFPAAEGAWHDSGRARVSLLSHASAAPWDVRRFRANLVLRGEGEDDLVGSTVRVGSAVLTVAKPIGRCVMVGRAIPGAPADPTVLRTVLRERDGHLAVGATVVEPGTVGEGDLVELV